MTRDQLSLFGAPPPRSPVGPAPVRPELKALAAALPRSVRFGTSSWSFPGWVGLVWDRKATDRVLSRHGLAAYAQHPLLRAVGLDRTHYQPMDEAAMAGLAAAVPDDFRFLVKAHDHITLARFPDHPRFGARRGETNPRFLDASYANDVVLGPTGRAMGPKLGTLLLQFAPQPPEVLGGPRAFAERLRRFLEQLPDDMPVAVEIRNAELLGDDYAEALLATGTRHCVNVLERMPPPQTQSRLARCARQDGLVVRWMLARGMDYGAAKAGFAPFDALVAEDPSNRRAVASLMAEATLAGHETTCIINNKAEGSAPRSIVQLAKALLQELDAASEP